MVLIPACIVQVCERERAPLKIIKDKCDAIAILALTEDADFFRCGRTLYYGRLQVPVQGGLDWQCWSWENMSCAKIHTGR